ncbi:hypothetical protein C9374_008676 [Naegleria lovaniensis]|uniref:C2 domain-containing protein n=1 Tax=Naegleria lovaniensis TaxID=51637 RepID=A0AA88GET5_NAELO|nr:uncharacterized protein C9374_008676 [Naegleria lovaniensis]KAG2378054.1 hypothetical protein C9374_008676 [Naegleria lovaniensis]
MFKALSSAPESTSDSLNEMSPYSNPSYRFTMTVVEGKGITGDRDVFCKLCVNSPNCKIQKTKSKKGINPQWNQVFTFEPMFRNSPMIITLWNYNLLSKSEFLGCVRLVPMRIVREETLYDSWFQLESLDTPRYRNTPIMKGAQIRLQITWTRLIDRIELVHYGFDEKIEKSVQRYVKDTSGRGIHLRFKNLDTDDIESAEGVVPDGRSAYFSGFNYLESNLNPTRNVTEFTISFWFKCEEVEKDFIMLSTVTTNKSIILQEYNSNLIHQLNTDSATSHLEKLFMADEFNQSPIITLTTSTTSTSNNWVNSPTQTPRTLSVHGMNDEKKLRRLSLNSLAVLNTSFNKKSASKPTKKEQNKLDEEIISMSGFSIGTKASEFYDCRGQSLVTKKKKKQKTISSISPSPVPEISSTTSNSDHAKTIDYEVIFGDILSKITDSEEGYGSELGSNSTLQLKIYDDDDDDSVEEEFPKHQLFLEKEWNHLAYVYSGDRLREYINGVLTEDKKCDFAILGCGLNKLQVGASNDDYRFTGFKGCLDEIIVTNYAMSKREISKLYRYKDQ